ncbi:MAG: efflux RND transporter periplasmic adaptor subunit [Deltaproteobacteria bacterium]|nr:efflux RND transporter periplasmic adaptor subunit [Deltaproteobacteria bacterium]
MKKRIALVLLVLVIAVAALAAVKMLQFRAMGEQAKKAVPPPEPVTTAVAGSDSWEISLSAVGTLVPVQGVTVAAELTGKVVEIAFQPGEKVQKGDLLIRQDTSSEEAQLSGAAAQAELTRTVLARNAQLLPDRIVSQTDYDASAANREQATAQTDNIRALIGKKTIRAPFSGRLGIRQVNSGQILREGDPIVTLQSLDPIFVNFGLPQQDLSRLRQGLPVRVTCDALPGLTIAGLVSAVNPLVDADTRNIQIQATLANREEKLLPGMFVNVAVRLPVRKKVLVIPATAVLYAPYGDSVFVVTDVKEGGKAVRQQFVRLGEKRGDFVAVADGLKAGENIVSTGVFKLRNGQSVVIDNRKAPTFKTSPTPGNG